MQGYVESIFLAVDTVTEHYVYNGYTALVGKLNYILAPLFMLAVALKGYKMWFDGEVKLNEFWYFTAKIGFIYGIGLSWGQFSKLFMGLFQSAIDTFGSALLSANPLHIPGITSINMSLQLTSNIIDFITSALFQQAGITHLGLFFYAGLIWIIGYAVIAIAMLEMIIAKIMMAVLFTVAPIMIVSTLFKTTKGVFDRWLGNLIGFSMLLIMISAMLGMIMGIIYDFMPITAVSQALPSSFFSGLAVGIVPMLICLVIAIYAITKLSGMAMHIGGGASSAGIGAIVGGMMAGGMISRGINMGSKGYNKGLQALKNFGKSKSKSK